MSSEGFSPSIHSQEEMHSGPPCQLSSRVRERKDYAVKRDQREAHGKPELPFGLSQYEGGVQSGSS